MHRLFLLPYVLLPVLLSLMLRWLRLDRYGGFNYLITLAVLFFYPYWWFQWMDHLNPPPPHEGRCGNVMMGVWIGSWMLLLPAAFVIQWVANRLILRKGVPAM
jgi:ABC-type sugar transport system permease subunit